MAEHETIVFQYTLFSKVCLISLGFEESIQIKFDSSYQYSLFPARGCHIILTICRRYLLGQFLVCHAIFLAAASHEYILDYPVQIFQNEVGDLSPRRPEIQNIRRIRLPDVSQELCCDCLICWNHRQQEEYRIIKYWNSGKNIRPLSSPYAEATTAKQLAPSEPQILETGLCSLYDAKSFVIFIIGIFMRRLTNATVLLLGLLVLAQTSGVIILNRGCREFSANGDCISCSTRYYKDEEGICQPVNSNCNAYNQITGACITCYSGFVQVEDTCLPEALFPAQSITDPFCNQFDGKTCTKCSTGYYFGLNGKCTQADPNCREFDSKLRQCLSCYAGFELKNNSCVISAPDSTSQNCNTFLNGVCQKCSFGFYFDSARICQKIPDTCMDFDTNARTCKACYTGYVLNTNNECVKGQAQPIDPGCSTFQNNICVKCSVGYYFNPQNRCRQIPASCANFNPAQQVCLTCYPGYALNSVGVCIAATNAGDSGCAEFKDGKCVRCSTGFYFSASLTCLQIPATCANFDTSRQVCTQCYTGYSLDANRVCVVSTVDLGCAEFKDGICIKCSTGFYFGKNGGCKQVPTTCSSFDVKNERCQACYTGYSLDLNNQCVKSQVQAVQGGCNEFKNGVCVKCSFGYYFNKLNICVQIPATCSNFNTQTETCSACYPGYALDVRNQCVKQEAAAIDAGCAEFKNNLCVKCSVGFYFGANGNCKQVPATCSNFNTVQQKCTACYPGYSLDLQSNCIKSDQSKIDPYCKEFQNNVCVACSAGAYFNSNRVCVLIDPSCRTFDQVNARCSECYVGYSIQDGKCVKAAPTTGDPFCKTFNNNICVECAVRYYKGQDGKCKEVNPSCREYQAATGSCTSCYIGFKLDGQACVEDKSVLLDPNCAEFKNGLCLRCSTGSFFDEKKNLCQLVDPLCKTFDPKNGSCLSCYPAFTLNGARCLEDLYFSSQNPNCAEFQDSKCIKCSSGFYFNKDQICTAFNPLCQTSNTTNGDCLSCFIGFTIRGGTCVVDTTSTSFNCAEFSSSGVCKKCSTGYYFDSNNKCQISNPLCKFFDQNNGKCTECYIGFILQKGECRVDQGFGNGSPLCAEWKEQICLRCATRAYFNDQGVCTAVSPLCRYFNPYDGSCETCYAGFQLEGNTCVAVAAGASDGCAEFDQNGVCVRCEVRAYLQNAKCVRIDTQCANFDLVKKECVGCYSGYSILNGKCEITEVDQGKEIQNCYAYTPEGSCLECLDRFYVVGGNTCSEVSVFCKKYSKTTGQCTECYTGFSLAQGQCARQ